MSISKLTDYPRVYLDTAVLHNIADQLGAHEERTNLPSRRSIQSLVDAVTESDAALLVSVGHIVDLVTADEETRARFVAALRLFPRVLGVACDPFSAQYQALRAALDGQPQSPRWDLYLAEFPRVDDLVSSSQLESARSIAQEGARIHEGRRLAATFRRPDERMKKRLPKLVQRLLAADSEHALAACLQEWNDGDMLTTEEQVVAGGDLTPVLDLFRQMKSRLEFLSELYGLEVSAMLEHVISCPESAQLGFAGLRTPGGFERWLETARLEAPGMYVVAALLKAQVRNVQRQPQQGDRMDFFHAFILPFVDVATIDRANFPALSRALLETQTARGRVALKNPGADLRALVQAVRESAQRQKSA